MIWMQISSAHGPAECELAVAKACARVMREAKKAGASLEIIERIVGKQPGTFKSVLMALEGESAPDIAERWRGTIQWICKSPYRPRHLRKNWFIGVGIFSPIAPAESDLKRSDLRFTTCRATGPGGQHINKTNSAVRATHPAQGISVKVHTHRSQHANKALAVQQIERRLAEQHAQAILVEKFAFRMFHHEVSRGNPQRVFAGLDFEPLS